MRYRISSLVIGWVIGVLSSGLVRRRLKQLIVNYAPEHFRRQIEEKRLEVVQTVQRFGKDFKSSTPMRAQNRKQAPPLKHLDRSPGHRPRQTLK